jgi:hypothetical protein
VHDSSDLERTLALFIGELAREEISSKPPSPRRETESSTPREAAMQEAPSPRILATGGVRYMAVGGAFVSMVRIEGGLPVTKTLRIGVVGRFGHSGADDALGSITANMASGGVAATYDIPLSSALTLATGPRGEFGWMGGEGSGTNGSSASTLSLSSAWEVQAVLRMGGPLGFVVAIEGGYVGRGLELHAADRRVLDLSGPFAGVSAGVAVVR